MHFWLTNAYNFFTFIWAISTKVIRFIESLRWTLFGKILSLFSLVSAKQVESKNRVETDHKVSLSGITTKFTTEVRNQFGHPVYRYATTHMVLASIINDGLSYYFGHLLLFVQNINIEGVWLDVSNVNRICWDVSLRNISILLVVPNFTSGLLILRPYFF